MLISFQPFGNSVLVAASSSTSGAGQQVSTGGAQTLMIANASTIPVYLAVAASSAVQAACPTTAVPAPGMALLGGNQAPITIPPQGWLSAVTSGGAASLFVTPGAFGS